MLDKQRISKSDLEAMAMASGLATWFLSRSGLAKRRDGNLKQGLRAVSIPSMDSSDNTKATLDHSLHALKNVCAVTGNGLPVQVKRHIAPDVEASNGMSSGAITTIQIQCAWCKDWIGEKSALNTAQGAISHGICKGCELEMFR